MSKTNRLYKIFMTSMIVIIAGMLLATGIIAIQKSMKLNAKIQMLPFADIEIWAENEESEILLFRNFDKSEEDEISVNKDYTSISGNTLALKDLFVTTFETEFTITVKNFSSHGVKVDLSSTATVEGLENATGVPATITPSSQNLGRCSNYENPTTAEFEVVVEAVVPQKTNLLIEIGELSSSTLKTGQEVSTAIGYNATSVVFDYWSDEYETKFGQTWEENTTDLSADENDSDNASIKIFATESEPNAKYILSQGMIMANADCSRMFVETNMNSIEFKNFNTDNTTTMRSMFYMTGINSLYLENFNTSKVTDMSYMFTMSTINSINLGKWNTSCVVTMERMFWNSTVSNISVFNLGSTNTEKLTNLSYMFSGCSYLTSLDLSSFDTSGVTNMSSMFASCRNLTSLDLSNFNTSNVTDMSYMFENCSNLTTIKVSSSKWTTAAASVTNMFRGCGTSTLTYV